MRQLELLPLRVREVGSLIKGPDGVFDWSTSLATLQMLTQRRVPPIRAACEGVGVAEPIHRGENKILTRTT